MENQNAEAIVNGLENGELQFDPEIVDGKIVSMGVVTSMDITRGAEAQCEESDDEIEESEEDIDEEDEVVELVKAEPLTTEEKLANLGEAAMDDDVEITADDIKNEYKNSSYMSGVDLNDDEILKILNIVNRIKNKENVNVYAELPDSVRSAINKYLADNGIVGFTPAGNAARKEIAHAMINEFIADISVEKTIDGFNDQMENMFEKAGKELSAMYADYEKERTSYLESLLEKVPEDDPKRETLIKTLDSIYDAFKLERLKEVAAKFRKVKPIELEKPQQRVFAHFENKYKDVDYHMYSLSMCLNILDKHNTGVSHNDNLKFLIAFAKFCKNYDPSVSYEHAFMYYATYNIVLLDIYKGEELEDYAPKLLENINAVIAILNS